MSELDTDTVIQLKIRLRERAARLREEIKQTQERSADETHALIAEQPGDAEDDSFSNLIVDVNLSEINRDADELKRIDEALHRLLDGRYGICENCSGDIPIQRLQVEPTAIRCIRCQELYEQTHAVGSTPRL